MPSLPTRAIQNDKSYAVLQAKEIIKKWPFLAMTNADYVYYTRHIYRHILQGSSSSKLNIIERKEDKRGSGHALKVW